MFDYTKYTAKYYKKNISKSKKYVGVCTCDKCGKKGYKQYRFLYNKKTKNYHSPRTLVDHQHNEDGKTVHDGECHIGMGKL